VDAHTGRESDASTVEGVLDADAWAREQAAAELGL
jgi:1-deoxy-D-xylulose-5-phosphate reductoisomerase